MGDAAGTVPQPAWRRAATPALFVLLALAIVAFFFGDRLRDAWRGERQGAAPPRDLGPLPGPKQLISVVLPAATAPTDWPQWRGPKRDGVALDETPPDAWPEGGPKLLWTAEDLGTGYTAPAVVGGKLFVCGSRGGAEFVFVLDAATGKPLGDAVIGHFYPNDWGGGPRGTPTVDGPRLYALGGDGALLCLELATGEPLWRKHIYRDFGSQAPMWGCGESPLVDGDRVLVTPGGRQGTVAALNKLTGDVLWRSTALTDEAGYSSLMPADFGGVRQYVVMTFHTVAGVAAADGKLLWRYAREGPNAPVPTPIIKDDLVFATSGYGAGCHLIRISRQGDNFEAREVYANKEMSNHHGGVVRLGDRLFGHAEGKGWRCLDLMTGEPLWNEKRKLSKGSVTAAGGLLFCYGEEDGALAVVEPNDKGWKERGRFKIPRESALPRKNGKIWTHPVIADGKLFLRDQELLFCYSLR